MWKNIPFFTHKWQFSLTFLIIIYICNQYYSTVAHLLIIYSNIFVMEHHWKTIWPRGDSNLRRRYQYSTEMHPQKRMHQAKSQATLSFPIRPMLILTSWLTLFLLCNQYY